MKLFGFWRNIDEDDRVRLVKTSGIIAGLFTLFTLLSIVSYLFTWKADQSLFAAPVGDISAEVRNLCGKLGFRWSDFLVRHCFGLGSFALIVILFAVSVRLLAGRWHYSMLRTFLLTLTGTMGASLILGYISSTFGLANAFGGGLGGRCGDSVIAWLRSLFGDVFTPLLLLALVIFWLFLASNRFTRWFNGLWKADSGGSGRGKRKKSVEEEVEDEGESTVISAEKVLEPVAVLRPAPVPVPAVPPRPSVQKQEEKPRREGGDFEIVKDNELSTKVQHDLPRINVRDELPLFRMPSLELLDEYASQRHEVSEEELHRNNNKIRATLANYKIQVNDVQAIVGQTVTLYKVYPAPGVKISEIKKLQEDIGMYLHARGVRVVTLTDSVGIEVANDCPSVVPMRAVLNNKAFINSKAELPVAIGYTIQQSVKVFDLADAPHLLVAGATKQGKSVGLNAIVTSLLYSKHPSELKLVFIDPKMVEFSAYSSLLHHYLAVLPCNDEQEEVENSIVKKADKAEKVLRSLCIEMDQRYELLSKALVPNIKLYNEKYKDRRLLPTEGHRFLPYIVTVIDEYADLTMSVGGAGEARNTARSITTSIIRLAQKGRAAGIHVILATQRPSADVITGLIKTNFPTRIAFRVVSRIDSSVILDSTGAEKLIGKGDMLYYAGVEMERVQCAYISPDEIHSLTKYISSQTGYKKSYNTPYYLPEVLDTADDGSAGGSVDMNNIDERFEEAARLVVQTQRGSTSDLQRRLGMGYAKAGRVMDQLESAGIVGHQEGSKPRQVLVSTLEELETILASLKK
ncbi:MAG: DNA translocase FtsK [Candidatus Cryptobacteroides sp.]